MNDEPESHGRIALIEDDDAIRELLQINLDADHFKVDSFFSIEQCEKTTPSPQEYDLIILDIMLPGQSGLQWAKKLKAEGVMVPILFISALSQSDTMQQAYDLGAIDYIVKPFDIELLLTKVRNLLFYFVKRADAPLPGKVGTGSIDWELMQVSTNDGEHQLSLREAELLVHFLRHPGQVISRRSLIDELWGEKVYVSERNIDNFLVKFRKLFGADTFVTYPKQGYAYKEPEA